MAHNDGKHARHEIDMDTRYCDRCSYSTSLATSQGADGGICPKCGAAYPSKYHHIPATRPGDAVKITGGLHADMTGYVVTIDEKTASVNLDYDDGYATVPVEYLQNITRPSKWVTMDDEGDDE